MRETLSISVVVPLYHGANYLEKLTAELADVRARWASNAAPFELAEVVIADDAAIDNSADIADRIGNHNPWIRVVHLSRNFGQHPATMAGILNTSGDWVVTLDEDLQHPPGRIEDLLRAAALAGADLVYANAEDKVHGSMVRDLGSRFWKMLLEKMTGNPNIRVFNSFRLIRGDIARAAAAVCSQDTYLDVAFSWFTQRVEIVSMDLKDERFVATKTSGYNLRRLMSHARRMLLSSDTKFIRFASGVGVTAAAISAVVALALTIRHFTADGEPFVRGWASLFLAVVFFGGLITAMLGAVLEYLALLVRKAHGKPAWFAVDRSSDVILQDYFAPSRDKAKARANG